MMCHLRKKTALMSTYDIQAAHATPSLLGECPVWHPDESALYWIDIPGKAVRRLNPGTGDYQTWNVPSEPGCLARTTRSGVMIVAMRSGIVLLDTKSGDITPVADAPYGPGLMRFNDGRCDAAGRLWSGTLYDPRDKPAGSLFCIERGRIRDVGHPVTVSNGVAFSVDNRTLYHADTTAHRITAYDFDLTSGTVANGRLFKQFSNDKSNNYGGRPDGAAVDSEDAYWCAMYEGGRILRLSPTGEVLTEIALPVRCPTMVAFGGPDLKTLYVTTGRHNRSDEELQQHPLSGCVLAMRVDVPGRSEPAYLV
jgi:sugar lactone lactonase YvrE